MKDNLKTNEQLVRELEELYLRIARSEEAEAKHQKIHAELFDSREQYRSILEASPN